MQNISVYRRRDDGKLVVVREFESYNQLFDNLSHNETEFLNSFSDDFETRRLTHPFSWDKDHVPQNDNFGRDWSYVRHPYVVTDRRDRIVPVEHLLGMYRAYRKKKHSHRYPKFMIPQLRNPGHKRGGGYGYYRAIRTTQEIRMQDAWKDVEHAPPVRRRRELPNSWDDISRSDWRIRSWKRHRSHQWKENK